ncbi:MAG: HPr family phosphocarrier protein [Candidatus Omnitrophica bacterium]|nr:HPr family phosphocarrier protein [Candidatus Omnitrophota bacterium]
MAHQTVKKEIIIRNKQGLHARPAAVFVQIANKFDSDITVRKEDEEVNGKSIMGILMLAAEQGASVCIKATGSDAEEAVAELESILTAQDEEFFAAGEKKDDKPERRKR